MNFFNISDLLKIYYNVLEAFNIIEHIYFIFLSFIFLIITLIILGYRFQVIVNKTNKESPITLKTEKGYDKNEYSPSHLYYRDALLFTVLGGIVNFGGLGKLGIPTKTVLLKKKGYSINSCITSVTIDMTFDILFSFLVLIISIIFFIPYTMIDLFNIYIIMILLIIIVLLFFKFKNKDFYLTFFKNLKKIDNVAILEFFVITSISWALSSISYYLIIKSTNEEVNLFTIFIIFTISVMIGVLSPIAGGIGVREGMLTYLSSLINIAPSKGILIAIIHRILSFLSLLFLLIFLKLKIKAMNQTDSSLKNYASETKREIKAKKIISILQSEMPIKNKMVLEIGSGHGHIINQFQKTDNYSIGIEKLFELVKLSKNKHEKCEFICGDGTKLPIKNNIIEIIVLNHVIEHIRNKEELIKESNRILKEDGIIYIASPNKHFLIDPHTKIPMFGYMGQKIHDKFNIYNPSKNDLIKLFEDNNLLYTYKSIHIIDNISEYEDYNTLINKFISKCFKYTKFPIIEKYFIPTHIFILRKKVTETNLF